MGLLKFDVNELGLCDLLNLVEQIWFLIRFDSSLFVVTHISCDPI